jgi:hypothetical protein
MFPDRHSGVLLLGDTYLHYSNPDTVPHYKFGMGGHRDFLFFPPEAIGTTIPFNLSRQFPKPLSIFKVNSSRHQLAQRQQRTDGGA